MLFTQILKDNKGFALTFRKGRSVGDSSVVMYFLPNKTPYNRLGISVSKKIGGAVERNRAKRIIRAAYRACESEMPIGYNIVFAAKPAVNDKKSTDIERFIRNRAVKEINRQALKQK